MQFIETSDLGVRVPVYRLVHADAALEWRLFPMLHIGEPAYYAEVQQRLAACDAILYEGVASRQVERFTRAYRWVEKVRSSGLVTQDALDLRPFRDRLIHADLAGESFDAGWRGVPWWDKLLRQLALPWLMLAMGLAGPRRWLARTLEQDDLPSRQEVLMAGVFAGDAVILGARDAHLREVILAYQRDHGFEHQTVGVLWGAGHMRAITHVLLQELGYRVAGAEWLTAFAV